jgi:hypothetical protein
VNQNLHHLGLKVPSSASFFYGVDLWLNQPIVNEKVTLHARITSSNCPKDPCPARGVERGEHSAIWDNERLYLPRERSRFFRRARGSCEDLPPHANLSEISGDVPCFLRNPAATILCGFEASRFEEFLPGPNGNRS